MLISIIRNIKKRNMKKEIIFKYKKRRINLKVEDCNTLKKFTGLMFSQCEKAKALLFDFKKPTKIRLHSIFVFFPFVAIWLDEKDNVLDLRIVKPFNFSVGADKYFYRLVEIPINRRYKKIINFLVGD